MKKILYIFSLVGLFTLNSCSDDLNTEPTNKVSGSVTMADASSAEAALNGIYRAMYVSGWSTNWASENFGQTSINLLADLMGEDHLMLEQGQGWFYEDYRLNVHGDYTGKNGRSYSIWNFYYTLVSNANYIIGAENTMGGAPDAVKNVVGQAYAIRAFSYYYLAQLFQQTYVGNEQKPGIPLYNEPTVAGSIGKSRGTLAEVYTQINADINQAISLLQESSGKEQKHPSHIDYYVANGIKARIALTQHEYATAASAADEALKRPNLKLLSVKDLGGNNNSKSANVLWGYEIIADQSTAFASFFSNMDADVEGKYASKARQCISSGLYKLIPSTDDRLAWWRGKLSENGSGSNASYCQIKFKMIDPKTSTGDYLVMRAEEMVLIKAEALCHQEQYTQARQAISILGNLRDKEFVERLATRTDNKSYNMDTNAPLQTLMDEILFQRRVELWGESGRIFDLQRLGLGYNRTYADSNHTQKVATKNTNAASDLFILPLPQSEIDGNENINPADQNPVVQ
ncbi:MAG: RagB/SusD family nutrient uptake outer membrane protein [Bacteroides sp.]|uniref:RagB/SusD family nutrient uptake outer membrane protein n=1 Tax=Bacteroides sp. TaxID=29523 RepID=UPI001B6D4E2E|nr:RagB/SusD family nutrient uptake outer membrane protein [Bacteroides sp.]MBP6065921.1 RagB/SusD family nutrient uptake outer membrane protein [Bacteroides sp.]MBP6526914.1 RagB/SusD family nutrient uptake outer membrane protein [Prevotella sp.]